MKFTTVNELRSYLSLEQPQLSSDGAGGSSVVWVKITDLWAKVMPLSGREVFSKDQVDGRITHQVTIRYRDGVLPDMRLVKGDRVFEIIAVMNEQDRKRWLRLDCIERQL